MSLWSESWRADPKARDLADRRGLIALQLRPELMPDPEAPYGAQLHLSEADA